MVELSTVIRSFELCIIFKVGGNIFVEDINFFISEVDRWFNYTLFSQRITAYVFFTIFIFQKLRKANEDIKNSTSRGQQELDTWKDTCDRLTASVSRKEAEIQDLQDKCLDNEDLVCSAKCFICILILDMAN